MSTSETLCTKRKKSIIPFLLTSAFAVFYVAPLEARGQFSIFGVVVKLAPILYLILYLNSYLDTTFEAISGVKGRKKDDFWKDRRHLATGVLCGLFCSAVGDFLLLTRTKDDFSFVLGTAAFSLAQICYIHAIGFHCIQPRNGIFVFLLAAIPSLFILHKAAYAMRALITAYGALLSTSLWRAIDRIEYEDGRSYRRKTLLALGALSFLISDMWIGVTTFLIESHSVSSVQFILLTYYVAQGLIAVSVS